MTTATLEAPSTEVTARTDIFGKPIAPKDMIVYATRRGSETFLNKLSVTEVTPKGIRGFNPDDVTRRIRLIVNMSTVAKVS